MSKIVEFKTKQTKFKEWIQEVIKENFENENIESAILYGKQKTKKGIQMQQKLDLIVI